MSFLGDGYHALGPGKMANVVTYLEMTAPPAGHRRPIPEGWSLRPVDRWEIDEFRRLYVEIGWEWLWFSRMMLSDADLEERLHRPGTRAWTPVRDGRPLGVLEMDFARGADVEISFFGLVPDVIGRGAGGWLMGEAIAVAFSRPDTRRLWLHTCTLDSPQALPFYQRMGFTPFARAVEVHDDPRLVGRLDESAGPRVPLIRNQRRPDGV